MAGATIGPGTVVVCGAGGAKGVDEAERELESAALNRLRREGARVVPLAFGCCLRGGRDSAAGGGGSGREEVVATESVGVLAPGALSAPPLPLPRPPRRAALPRFGAGVVVSLVAFPSELLISVRFDSCAVPASRTSPFAAPAPRRFLLRPRFEPGARGSAEVEAMTFCVAGIDAAVAGALSPVDTIRRRGVDPRNGE